MTIDYGLCIEISRLPQPHQKPKFMTHLGSKTDTDKSEPIVGTLLAIKSDFYLTICPILEVIV